MCPLLRHKRACYSLIVRTTLEVGRPSLVLPGEQPAILDRDLFDAGPAKLNDQRNNHTASRATETSSAPMSSASKSKRTSWRSNSKHLNKDSLADEKTRRHKSATPASWKQTHGSFRSLAKTAVET